MIAMRWVLFFFCLTVAALPATGDNHPDEAAALGKYLAAHGYGVVRVDADRANDEILEAKIDGKRVRFRVDTGAVHTVITTSCARRIGLDVHETKLTDFGIGGEIQGHDGLALVKSFTINDYEINRLNLITVLPKTANMEHGDGLFGFDYLRANAVLLPVGARFLFFKPGGTVVPPLEQFMSDLGFKAVPLKYELGGLHIEGHLNGHPLRALVDCGAALSVFNISYVTDKAGITASYVPNFRFTGVDGHQADTFKFTPQSLDYGAFSFTPSESIAISMPTADRQQIDALLGYDLLAAHQAIIDLGHETLWMK